MSAIGRIRIDTNSNIAAPLQRELVALMQAGELTLENLAYAMTLAIAQLEACVFGGLNDPIVD